MLERVKEIIEEQLNVEGVEITEETRFKEDLEADSLDLFELVMNTGLKFHRKIWSRLRQSAQSSNICRIKALTHNCADRIIKQPSDSHHRVSGGCNRKNRSLYENKNYRIIRN